MADWAGFTGSDALFRQGRQRNTRHGIGCMISGKLVFPWRVEYTQANLPAGCYRPRGCCADLPVSPPEDQSGDPTQTGLDHKVEPDAETEHTVLPPLLHRDQPRLQSGVDFSQGNFGPSPASPEMHRAAMQRE